MGTSRAPGGLGMRGRRLWNAIAADFEVTPDSRELLLEACRSLDRCEELEQQLNETTTVVVNASGVPRAHPLLAELRQWRLTAARLLDCSTARPARGRHWSRDRRWAGLGSHDRLPARQEGRTCPLGPGRVVTVRRKRTDVARPDVREHLIGFERLMLAYAVRVGDHRAVDAMIDRITALESGESFRCRRSDLPAGVLDHLPPDATIEIDSDNRLRVTSGHLPE